MDAEPQDDQLNLGEPPGESHGLFFGRDTAVMDRKKESVSFRACQTGHLEMLQEPPFSSPESFLLWGVYPCAHLPNCHNGRVMFANTSKPIHAVLGMPSVRIHPQRKYLGNHCEHQLDSG